MNVKQISGNYICLKHNKSVQMIVLDKQFNLADSMLCNDCMNLKSCPINQVVGVLQANDIIKEKLKQENADKEDKLIRLLNNLESLQEKLIEQKDLSLMTLNAACNALDQWIYEIRDFIQSISQIDLRRGLELYYSDQGKQFNLIEKNNDNHFQKLEKQFQQLLQNISLEKCYQEFQKVDHKFEPQKPKIIEISQSVSQISTKQSFEKQANSFSYKLINQVKQEEDSYALAFNNSGSILVVGQKNNIRVQKFDNGKLSNLTMLRGSSQQHISCLLFSKKHEWFISGDCDRNLQAWKQEKNNTEWITNGPVRKHTSVIRCLIMNKNEDQLFSCSDDNTIMLWNLKYATNQIEFLYTFENKSNDSVRALTLNESETQLVSCGGKRQLILWVKGENGKWMHKTTLQTENDLQRACFITDNQIIALQWRKDFLNVFETTNHQLKENFNLKVVLPKQPLIEDLSLFPIINNKAKGVIIIKQMKFVFIIRKQANGQFKIEGDPIDCENAANYGTLSESGQYLIIWNIKTKEFRVYQLYYD